ncbi:MAG: riboflavin synthase [Streptosporangiales bacterium]|nr:riboflavin synthase [Streptosporangiales bacterium]
MFTGIVEELGEVVAVEPRDDWALLTLRSPMVVQDAKPGDSVAVNGVCLTVVDVAGELFSADVVKETLSRSSLGELVPGSSVNLERPLRFDGRLGGHLVQGHVDGTGRILSREQGGQWEVVRISLPAELARYVVPKGSVAVDGVSLTVVDVDDDAFTVSLIPATLRLTVLGSKAPGELVNLEVDVIAKYVERLLPGGEPRGAGR